MCYIAKIFVVQLTIVTLYPCIVCGFIQENNIAITPKCHKNTISQCSSDKSSPWNGAPWRYTNTTYPNFLKDFTEDEVRETMQLFHPLFATECSRFARMFACSVATPLCTPIGIVPPCKELCNKVLGECKEAILAFNMEWPSDLSCDMFPSFQQNTKVDELTIELTYGDGHSTIISEQDRILMERAASMTWVEALAAEGTICIPPLDRDVVTPLINQYIAEMDPNALDNAFKSHQYGVVCPAKMRSPNQVPGYQFLKISNCSSPCKNMYLSSMELDVVRYVVVFMAVISTAVTLFTICTFIIDRHRFQYPERTMVFYAISYFVVSVTFLVGFVMKETIACNAEVIDPNTNDIVQGFTMVKGGHKQSCTIMFMILYYFTAGLKWASESIAKYNMYYHAVAWTVPALQTIAVIIFGKIEGDNITGVCFVGIHDSVGLRFLVLLPLAIYLFIGVILLIIGFVCLCPIGKILKNDKENKRNHHKYRIRLAIFCLLYVAPQILLFGIYVVEDKYRDTWEATWFKRSCDDYRVPCPADASYISKISIYEQQPHAVMFCAKYILILVVALAPLFWIASKKTVLSWRNFICGSNGSNNGINGNNKRINKDITQHNESTMPLTNETLRTVADGTDEIVSVIEDDAPVFNEFAGSKKFGSSASVAVLNSSGSSALSSRSSSISSTVSSSMFAVKKRSGKRRLISEPVIKPVEVTKDVPPPENKNKELKKIFPPKKSSSASASGSSKAQESSIPSMPVVPPRLHTTVAINATNQSSSSAISPQNADANTTNIICNSNPRTLPPSSRPRPPVPNKPVLTASVLAKHNNIFMANSRPTTVIRNGGNSAGRQSINSKDNVVEV